ncbi:MAG TPA: membrane protein insertase YidC [Burkholderiales bacterium]|nr:membrane protein insertase YidC [Burkholderiales bacterium]
MESQRFILFFIFAFSLFLLFDAWQRDQNPPAARDKPVAAAKQEPGVPPAPGAAAVPAPGAAAVPTPSVTAPAPAPTPAPSAGLAPGQAVTVQTDVFVAEISTAGGDLRKLTLKRHRDVEDKRRDFVLFDQRADHVYVAQSGLLGNDLPTHRTQYSAAQTAYQLDEGANVVEVRLEAPPANGVKVTKVYRFTRGSYLIDVAFEIQNQGEAPIQPHGYFQLLRDDKPPAGDSAMLPTFTGVGVYTEKEKFQKIGLSDIEKGKATYPKESNDGWIGMIQHYFVSAWLPRNGTPREFYVRRLDKLNAAGVIVPVQAIQPGGSTVLSVPLYAGPQDQDKLAELAPGLDLSVDYGWLTIIASPLFWLLKWFYGWVGNWGVAIILLTVVIKLIFYPLSEASYRSMAKMRVLAPKLQRLKEQYGEDRQRMQQAMMELYKTEKINPLGGCLPIIVQIPVFIALYWVLLASVELRHAPFMLWIDDLSRPDTLFGVWFGMPVGLLPILMGATMIIQTKLNPEPPDPVQAKVMKIMPIAFSVFFFFFPAGLVLYWLVNNILSIAQQWHINRVLERANLAPPRKR